MTSAHPLDLPMLVDLGVAWEALMRSIPTWKDKDGLLHGTHKHRSCLTVTDPMTPEGTSVLLDHTAEELCFCLVESPTKDPFWYFCGSLCYVLAELKETTQGTTALQWKENHRRAERLEENIRDIYRDVSGRDPRLQDLRDAVEEFTRRARASQAESLAQLQSTAGRTELRRRMGNPLWQSGQVVVAVPGRLKNPQRAEIVDAVLLAWGEVSSEGIFCVFPREFQRHLTTWIERENMVRTAPVTLEISDTSDAPGVLEIARRLWVDGSFTKISEALAVARQL